MIKTSILALFSLLFMIFHAGLVTKGAAAGLLLWYSAVVPALFPFMVLSSILSASGGISWLMQPFTVVFRFCGLSADGWYVLLTGLLCGCPMGAKTCADFLAERRRSVFLFLCDDSGGKFLSVGGNDIVAGLHGVHERVEAALGAFHCVVHNCLKAL